VTFLTDLEADGWQLEAPVDDTFACLRNVHPKAPEERRLVEAWEIGAPGRAGWQALRTGCRLLLLLPAGAAAAGRLAD
jgi:hypothetical protein